MKQMRMLAVAMALLVGTAVMSAQDSKIAHIATQELVQAMPSYKAASADIAKLQKTYDSTINEMGTELQKTLERYGREAETQTDEENIRRQQEVEATRNKILEYRQNALQDLQKKEAELMKPIVEKARETIKTVARSKGYTYVLDSSPGSGVIMAEGYNLMADVKAKLGI
ncbi:OmpH family outer membrane protein [Croceiramulus getboli]|nr:OmpH family outer membrane protein [Flavobacteriaceae bacterium YJPT1-3]